MTENNIEAPVRVGPPTASEKKQARKAKECVGSRGPGRYACPAGVSGLATVVDSGASWTVDRGGR